MRLHLRLFFVVFGSLVFLFGQYAGTVNASEVKNRSLVIGTSTSGATTSYILKFDIQTVAVLGSIELDFCSNSPLLTQPCTAPNGFNASGVVLSNQLGEIGFSVDPSSTVNQTLLTRPPSLSSATTVSYTLSNVINPIDIGTVFARVRTFSTSDGSGLYTDFGGLAFSINRNFNVLAYVPPYLTFCVGVTVAGDCSSANGVFVGFGELSKASPKFVTSQFAGATNDPGGYSTFITGLTMTSGTNTIPGLGVPTPSIPGVSQFGMNLRANSNPGVGSDPSGLGSSVISPNFGAPNIFSFNNQIVTNSATSTDFNLFTVSYIVNISSNQSPGVYNTTLTYIATAAF